jgi:tRNA(fMet)-specific endonuclease VapC
MKYMLDTNICIDMIRQKSQALIKRLVACIPGEVVVSTITIAELAHAVQNSNRVKQNMAALEQFLLPLEIVNFDQHASVAYGNIRAALERTGNIIGAMDMLIGAHALSLKVTLVTNNINEFQHIPNLQLEDWTA